MKSKKFTVKTVALMLVMATMLGMFIRAFAVYDTPTFSDVPKNFWATPTSSRRPRRDGSKAWAGVSSIPTAR